MCGIAGFVQFDARLERVEALDRLGRMATVLKHRGPDDRGVWTDNVCGLAHARLAVIDITSTGHQPMTTADGRYWVVFNGEIYNFQSLRAELEARGTTFRSHSDTEVLLEGYRAWGDRVIDRLRGMFAFALWDAQRERLLLARDRLGKKPLFWARIGNALVFGSELKALVAWPGLDRSIDHAAVHQYLTYQYIPAPRTIFTAARKLPAAHKMVVERVNRAWRVNEPERYWRLPLPSRRSPARYDPIEAQARLIALLKESVRLRMISDVPLGAFLSGGVDSSAVVAMMAELSSAPVKTFSIGSPHAEYDETRYARMVAQRYGTDHHELILEPKAAEILPRLVWHYNEPYSDASMIPTYCVSELARRHVTVALNGDGGDEAFVGYPRYDTVRALAEFDHVPAALAPTLARALKALRGIVGSKRATRFDTLARRLDARAVKDSQRYAFTIVSMGDDHKPAAYGPAMRSYLPTSALDLLDPYFAEAPDFVSGANWADTHVYLPDDLLVKVDIASMAVSLEARSPLLDHELMEWAFSLPADARAPNGVAKGLFKKAMEPLLPHELLYRPKMGFGCPIDHWLRADLREMAHDLLLSDRAAARGIVNRDYVALLLKEHMSGPNSHHTRLFALLNMELWFRMWADQAAATALERPVAAAAEEAVGAFA
jgi:asparagine synthase (glutamine-hydrolysing)